MRTCVRPCLLYDACTGGRGTDQLFTPFSSAASTLADYDETRYCTEGYRGPYCAVCQEGYRRVSGYRCLSCDGGWGLAARVMLWVLIAVFPFIVVGVIVFLIDGSEAVLQASVSVAVFGTAAGEGARCVCVWGGGAGWWLKLTDDLVGVEVVVVGRLGCWHVTASVIWFGPWRRFNGRFFCSRKWLCRFIFFFLLLTFVLFYCIGWRRLGCPSWLCVCVCFLYGVENIISVGIF